MFRLRMVDSLYLFQIRYLENEPSLVLNGVLASWRKSNSVIGDRPARYSSISLSLQLQPVQIALPRI